MSDAALNLRGIAKSFGTAAVLSGIDLDVRDGEFIALVGPSGCGKSTLLRIAAGLEAPDSGQVLLAGRDVTHLRAADRDMAMVFQSYALYPHLTARQNMALPLAMRRLSAWGRLPLAGLAPSVRAVRAAIGRDVAQAAERLRITPLLDRKPAQMSGGQRQRVALGRALVRQPRAFLMDEPLSNLDAALRVHMRNEIVDLHRASGVMTLYVTHDQEEALGMADRVAVMLGGRLLQVAPPDEIYRRPAHIDVASFIGSPRINLLAARVSAAGVAEHLGHAIATGLPAGAGVTIGIRPEHLRLAADARPLALPAVVERVEYLGAVALVHCRAMRGDTRLIASLPPGEATGLHGGAPVHAWAADGQVLAFDAIGARLAARAALAEALHGQ